jgi:hypothetical protein
MKRLVALSLVAAALVACSKKSAPPVQTAAAAPSQQATTSIAPASVIDPTKLPPGHPPVAVPAQAEAQPQAQAQAPGGTLSGKVLETMDSGGYTYLKLRTDSGDVWAAVQQTKVKVGSTATIAPQMTLDNFESKTLKRKFDHIVFGVAAGAGAPPPTQPAAAQHMAAPPDTGAISVPKADGANAYRIAEIWTEKEKLKDATVVVRGKVVKFLPGIMGKNWLHLRDGSGSREKGDDDITVTTNDSAAVGDVVVVGGTLRIDKDFGAGYRYPVIVEEAKVSK